MIGNSANMDVLHDAVSDIKSVPLTLIDLGLLMIIDPVYLMIVIALLIHKEYIHIYFKLIKVTSVVCKQMKITYLTVLIKFPAKITLHGVSLFVS